MARRGTEIHNLQEKLRIFTELLHQADIIVSNSNAELARALGTSYETLKSAWREGRLSDELINNCAKLGHFENERHYFVDPNVAPKERSKPGVIYSGRDTVDAFRAMLLRSLNVAPIHTRILGKPQVRNRNIAWFQVDDASQARHLGSVSDLFLSIGLETVEYDQFLVGITEVRIRLSFSPNSMVQASRLAGRDKPIELNGAYLTAKPADMLPEWRLSGAGKPLNQDFVTTESPLLEVSGLKLGEEFMASLAFKPTRALHLEGQGIEPISLLKQRILSALFVESLDDEPDRDGWITLGVQKMRLVRGDQIGR